MEQIFEYYSKRKGSAATACRKAAWPSEDVDTTRVHMFTDGCAKQYKRKRNFRAVADSVEKLDVVIEHNFAATSHFKGTHDGIGVWAKNMMRNAELYGDRKPQQGCFQVPQQPCRQKCERPSGVLRIVVAVQSPAYARQAPWSDEVPRTKADLEGVVGSSKMYQFIAGAKRSVGVGCAEADTEPEGGKVITAMPRGDPTGSGSIPTEVNRMAKLHFRQGSCSCSAYRVQSFSDCKVATVYPELVGNMEIAAVKDKVKVSVSVGIQAEA